MKKLFQKIKGIFGRNKYKELEEKIDQLENRIFEKKKERKYMDGLSSFLVSSFLVSNWEPETLEKEIDILQEKLDAICAHFKVNLIKTEDKEGKWVVKKAK